MGGSGSFVSLLFSACWFVLVRLPVGPVGGFWLWQLPYPGSPGFALAKKHRKPFGFLCSLGC